LSNDDDKLNWEILPSLESGFAIDGEVRDIKVLNGLGNQKWILVSKNNENVELFSY
jgi:hypothetical protein